MAEDNHSLLTLMIETDDPAVAEEARESLPEAEVSCSSNFIGGTEIAAFFAITSLKSLREALSSVLKFLDGVRGRNSGAKVVIGKDQVSLEGFGRDDVERLLASDALRSVQERVASAPKA